MLIKMSVNPAYWDNSLKKILKIDLKRLLFSNHTNLNNKLNNSTIGVEFGASNIKIEDKSIRLKIWDTVST